MEKIQKKIAEAGYCSRRKAELLISEGKVFVNGEEATIGARVSENDRIEVEGQVLSFSQKAYFLLYKPAGYISTTDDEHNRKTVVELIDTKERIYPVGRLDANTSGLLILTNDGDLANRLIHPKYEIPKTYLAKVEGLVSMKDINTLKKGIYLDNVKIVPDRVKVKIKNVKAKTSVVEIVIHDGKNHEVKRLFEAIGYEVIALKRTTFAFLDLQNLRKGEYRRLNPKEVKKLYVLTR